MIQKLKIKNFQSHGETELEFHKGVNIVVGASDAGKSTIIRAIRWIIWNRPSGDAIRSVWGGETSAEIVTDGVAIKRGKDKTDYYELYNGTGKPTVFKAIGTGVPEELNGVLNLSEINISYQLDAPFLLSETPGDVAKHFNRVAKLDMIDRATSNINSAIRDITSDIKHKDKQIENYTEELSKFDHLEKFEAEVEVLEGMEKLYDATWKKWTKLGALILDYNTVKEDIERESKILQDEEKVNKLLELYEEKESKAERYESLRSLLDDLALVQDNIKEAQEYVEDEKEVNNLLTLYSNKKTVVERVLSVSKLLSNLTYTSSDINKKALKLKELEGKWEREFPDVCPLCGKPK